MIIPLSVKNKLEFIDNSITRPTNELLSMWIRNNNVRIAPILNFISNYFLNFWLNNKIYASVLYRALQTLMPKYDEFS